MVIVLFSVVFFKILLWVVLLFLNKVVLLSSVLLLMGYYLMITFVFLYKSIIYSRHTSLNLRFWKRAFYLFWSLEFFLFFIYIYLYVNSTFETWMLDITRVLQLTTNSDLGITSSLLAWTVTFLILFNLSSRHVSGFSYFLLLLLLILLTYFFYSELYISIYFSSFFFNYTFVFDVFEDVWNLELESFFSRPSSLYFYSLLILKLWHVVFMVIFFVFFFNNVLKSPKLLSQLNLFFLNQNFAFLFFFWYLSLLLFKKYFFLYYFSVVYSEMFITSNYAMLGLLLNYCLTINISLFSSVTLYSFNSLPLFIFFL